MNILLVGGDQENRIISKLVSNSSVSVCNVYSWPRCSFDHTDCASLPVADDAPMASVVRAAVQAQIDLVILTSECAIGSGIANALQSIRIPCFGPTRVASHFRWDPEHAARLLAATGIRRIGEVPQIQMKTVLRGKVVSLVSGSRTQGVGISNGLSESVSMIVMDRLAREIASVDSQYHGWLVLDVLQTEDGYFVDSMSCLPPLEYLESLLGNSNFDFVRRVKMLLHTEGRDLKNVVEQTLAPCLVPA